jgi:hypothetical protein
MQVISSALMCQTKIQDMSYFSIALSKRLRHNAITISSLYRQPACPWDYPDLK